MSLENTTDEIQKQRQAKFIRRRHLARTVAMQFLYQAESSNNWVFDEELFNDFMDSASDCNDDDGEAPLLSDFEAAADFARQLIVGALQYKNELDDAIASASKNWSINRMRMSDIAILRMATYEIIHEAKVSAATTINEAVELAKAYGEGDSPRFINGVLDKIRTVYGKHSKKQTKDEK